jgi:hypothetical protein
MKQDIIIPEDDLLQLLYIRLNDPTVFACINTILTILNIDGIELRSKKFKQFYGSLASTHYIPFFRAAIVSLITWGFCPYIDAEIEINTMYDEEYMATHHKTKTMVSVPVIPVFGSYVVKKVTDKKTFIQTIECQFKADLTDNHKKFPPIKIINSRMFGAPIIGGNTVLFQTPVSVIYNSYFNLAQLNSFAMQAYWSLANPTILLQIQKLTTEEIENSLHKETFGITDLSGGGIEQQLHYKHPVEIENRLSDRVLKYKQDCAKNADSLLSVYRDRTQVVSRNIPLERSAVMNDCLLLTK